MRVSKSNRGSSRLCAFGADSAVVRAFQVNGSSPRRIERSQNLSRPRRGSIYVLTLVTTMIVAVLAVAGLTLVRVQRRQIDAISDGRNAQYYAKFAVDMAWYRVQNDASWRSKMASGTWSTDQVIGDGFYSFTATDPMDGDLNDSAVDPVVIVGVGKSGSITQKLQMEIRALQPGLRCLEPLIHADGNLTFDGGSVTADRMVSANNNAEVKNGAQVYANAEAGNSIQTASGGIWYGTTTTAGTWPRQMPNIATLYDYYTFNGTTINYSDLPNWDDNQLGNAGMEDLLLTGWIANGSCTLVSSILNQYSGARSLKIINRNSASDGAAQDVTDKIYSGATYHVEVWLRPIGGGSDDDFRLGLKTDSTGSGVQYTTTAWTYCDRNIWTKVEGDIAISWTGSLNQAAWYVEGDDKKKDFYIDAAELKDANAASGWKVIDRQVLSPANNPFGSGVTNSKGIYIIDCGGSTISIKNSRVVGTLVLLNQQELDSKIEGSVHWAPAVISADPSVTNLPAIVTNKKLRLYFSSAPLDEGLANANFNPTGTAYNGSQDSDKSDTYPSVINGVVYSEKNVEVQNQPTIVGMLVGDNDVNIENATFTLKYAPLFYERNAPPGFQAAPTYYVVPNSYRHVVD